MTLASGREASGAAVQAIDGSTPASFGRDSPGAEVISLDEIRQKRLVQHSFANGLLHAYELVEAPPEDQANAAA